MQNKKMEGNDRTVDSDEIIHEKLIMCFKKKNQKRQNKANRSGDHREIKQLRVIILAIIKASTLWLNWRFLY